MTYKDKQTENDKASDVSKKPYHAPELTTFGTVAQVTEAGQGAAIEDFGSTP